jgi:4a-hydroxytetrahydrobiopterin dehydratase
MCEQSFMEKLNTEKIKSSLAAVPEWTRKGAAISRTYQFKDFPAAIQFVNAVAELAEQAWHHPDIDIRWNKVTLALTTHDAGGLTEKDFALAQKFDRLPVVQG